jgi:hypothetical protein
MRGHYSMSVKNKPTKEFLVLLAYFFGGVFLTVGILGVWETGDLNALIKLPLVGIIFGLPYYIGGVAGLAIYAYKRGR